MTYAAPGTLRKILGMGNSSQKFAEQCCNSVKRDSTLQQSLGVCWELSGVVRSLLGVVGSCQDLLGVCWDLLGVSFGKALIAHMVE